MEVNMTLGVVFGMTFFVLIGVLGVLLAIRETNRYNKSIEAEAEVIGQLLFISSVAIIKFTKSITNKRTKNSNNRIFF